MADVNKVIKAWVTFRDSNPYGLCSGREFRAIREPEYCMGQMIDDTIAMLKEQETAWDHLWDAPDGTFKGRCKKCGYVHFFIEGHNAQYKFCPECGRKVK